MNISKKILIVIVFFLFMLGILYLFAPGLYVKSINNFNRFVAGLERHEIQVDGQKWVYLGGGEGDTLLLLHGFGADKDLWGTMPRFFTDSYRVIIPDLPGFGESGRSGAERYGLREQERRLKFFTDRVIKDNFYIIGVSMGAGIAGFYASENPERVKGLVLIGALGVASPIESDAMKIYKKFPEATMAYRTEREFEMIMALVYHHPPVIPGNVKNFLIEKGKKNFAFHNKIFRELKHDGFGILEKRLSKIAAPALILWGEKDRIFHNSSAEIFRKGIKDSRVVIISDCGHLTYVDKPRETVRACSDFFKSIR